MNAPNDYDARVEWDCVCQQKAVREVLARHGITDPQVASEIDWIYRPALEDMEYRINHPNSDASR